MAAPSQITGFDEIFAVLSDGKFHSFEEVLAKCYSFTRSKLQLTLDFLVDYHFLEDKIVQVGTRSYKAYAFSLAFNIFQRNLALLEKGVKPTIKNSKSLDSLVEAEAAVHRDFASSLLRETKTQ